MCGGVERDRPLHRNSLGGRHRYCAAPRARASDRFRPWEPGPCECATGRGAAGKAALCRFRGIRATAIAARPLPPRFPAWSAPPHIGRPTDPAMQRSEEQKSELQSLMRISYAVFCLKKTRTNTKTTNYNSVGK